MVELSAAGPEPPFAQLVSMTAMQRIHYSSFMHSAPESDRSP